MPFRTAYVLSRFPFFLFALALWAVMGAASPTRAQTLDLSITDPDDIAAICGGDRAAGEQIFARLCMQCHEVAPDGPASVGPNLHAIFGRVIASDDFPYSSGLRLRGAGGMIWERETLSAYLTDPAAFAPGGSMNFPGIANRQELQDLMTWLRVASHPPPPPPGSVEVPQAVLDMTGDTAWGEYLASECVTCHRIDGTDAGIPKITGWPRKPFLTAMFEYRLRARDNAAMQMVAERLSDEELAALAAYFETLH